MIYRCIAPSWLTGVPRVVEGEFTDERVQELNAQGYNIYFLPNHPSAYDPDVKVDGSQVDVFNFVFVDMDLKDGTYATKQDFLQVIFSSGIEPTSVIDSGNGVHVYWAVTDLDAMSYLKLQRRLMRKFNTDEAVGQIFQLMRVPGSLNTKDQSNPKRCEILYAEDQTYTCEELDRLLPPITKADEEYCKQHYDKTYNINRKDVRIDDRLPQKFMELLRTNAEIKELFSAPQEDRSKADYRLGHIMFAYGFTRDEATSVLANTDKAVSRAPVHRVAYATNIIDKIWTYEQAEDKSQVMLSASVRDILAKSGDTIKGTRFPCWSYIDATAHGFRLSQVIGLVAGSGVGKTAMALNMFLGFVKNNPDYVHFFIPLEQPANEIADRWRTMCGENSALHDKVHVLSNYNDDGSFRHLSLDDIRQYLLKFQEVTGQKVGCVVIDHIGALKKKGKNGENQDLMDICHSMKAFAIETNTLLVMQSQAPREKAGIGDLELNKDAAYGTVYFESYCDYLITMWQPFKRCYSAEGCPTITAFKFCKIRHKKQGIDRIQEDVCYRLFFDPKTEYLRELTGEEEKNFDFWNKQATNKRKQNRRTEAVPYQSMPWTKDTGKEVVADEREPDNHKDKRAV